MTAGDAPDAPAEPERQPQATLDAEEKSLLHDERSCIFETRVERAERCRALGSERFKARRVRDALEWYERALFHVDFDEGTWHFEFAEKHRKAVNVVRLPVYLNLAACYLSLGEAALAGVGGEAEAEADAALAKATENADLALEIEPQNVKALYRGGRALLLRGELDDAKTKLSQAAKLAPTDRNIREAVTQLKSKLAAHKQQEKQRWGGRLLSESKSTSQQGPRTEKSESTSQQEPTSGSGLWLLAVVLIAVALALGQLSFVE